MSSAVPLRETQIEHAGFVLARAFDDDPFMTYAFPDPDHRFRELPWFFAVGVRAALAQGRVDTDARVAGAAVWLPPGQPELDEARMAARASAVFRSSSSAASKRSSASGRTWRTSASGIASSRPSRTGT